MKITIALLTAAISLAAAEPHLGHNHQHLHAKRDQTNVKVVPGPTVIAYVLNGEPITEHDVNEGIRNGTLVWANGGLEQQAKPAPTHAPPPQKHNAHGHSPPPPASPSPAPPPKHHPPPPPPPPPPSGGSGWGGSGQGVGTPFPDGQVACSDFPDEYGAVPVPWLKLGGWTGIQSPGSTAGGFGNIETVNSGGTCGEGDFCSYACPPGTQKSQWPSTQGSSGQSIGGLQCKGGKLHLTNKGLSNKLCIPGASEVTVQVKNKMSKGVAVCRTDYPGTEAETVPLESLPGSTTPLTCPDASSYYDWDGSHTSAQYYVNPAGVSVQDGCQWGSSGNPWGNYAPLNLGVGYSNGAAWLSIFQNAPTTSSKLDFTVEIQGDGLSGTCKYTNGQYCGGADGSECSATTGCTVSLSSGTATFVFSS